MDDEFIYEKYATHVLSHLLFIVILVVDWLCVVGWLYAACMCLYSFQVRVFVSQFPKLIITVGREVFNSAPGVLYCLVIIVSFCCSFSQLLC